MRRHHAKLYANELIYSTMREISVALADGNFGAVTMRQGLRCSANPWHKVHNLYRSDFRRAGKLSIWFCSPAAGDIADASDTVTLTICLLPPWMLCVRCVHLTAVHNIKQTGRSNSSDANDNNNPHVVYHINGETVLFLPQIASYNVRKCSICTKLELFAKRCAHQLSAISV